jgi:hypothetical protein
MAPGQEVLLQSITRIVHNGPHLNAKQYLVIGRDEEGNKIKMTPEDILMDKEDMRLAEKYGPEFIKCNQNSSL